MNHDGSASAPPPLREKAGEGANLRSIARYFEDVSVGDELTPLRKRIDSAHMMAYGAATWDFIRVHYDADYIREQGFPGPFMDGQMVGAFLAQLVQDWAGPGAFLRKLGFRNRVMAYPGDSLVCRGVVTALYREGDEGKGSGMAQCELWIENQRGERVVDRASAVVQIPLQDGSG